VHHCLTSVLTIKEIVQRELGLEKFSRRWVPYFLSPTQKVACIEASTEILRILHESEENHFEGITTGDEPRFQYPYMSSKMFARSPTDVIPRTRQPIGTKKTMITIVCTGRESIVLDILPKGSISTIYILSIIFSRFAKGKREFSSSDPAGDFCGHIEIQCATVDQSGIKIRESSCFRITAPALFSKHKPLRLLALWNVKESLERSQV
jgi:hypothetical protein